jgi:hypothetical protein
MLASDGQKENHLPAAIGKLRPVANQNKKPAAKSNPFRSGT